MWYATPGFIKLDDFPDSIPHIIVPLTYTLNCKSNVVSKAL